MSLGLLTLAMATAAQPADEAIVITGERSRRTIRTTSSSVEVFTAEKIVGEAGADRIEQLLEMTPNITVGTSSLGPTVRGQNTTGVLQDLPAFLGGSRSRMTLQVDGRAVSYNEFVFGAAPLWDVAQIEVFRSPQSTTQGRNSIAGAVFVETEDPVFEAMGKGRVIYGDIAMSQFSAAASGPIVADQLAFRISGDLRHGRPASKLTDTMVGADPNNDDYGVVRLKLLAQPSALPWLLVEGSFQHGESKMPQVEGVRAPFEQRRDPSPLYGVFGSRVDSLTAHVTTDAIKDVRTSTIFSAGDSRFQRFAPVGLGEAINKVSDWSVEHVFNWRPSPAAEITLGVHHLRTRLDQAINLTAVLGTGTFDDKQRSTGIFGEATVSILPSVRLTGGLRYQRDSQRRIGAVGDGVLYFPLDYDRTFVSWLPKLSLAVDVLPSATVGALIQRAYNPGGATLNFDTGDPEIFDAEEAWSYELFARASLGPARLSANLFHTSFRDAQRAQSRAYVVPGSGTAFWAVIENVPRSRSIGAEISVDWPVTGRLRFAGGIGLLRTRITHTDDPSNPINGKEFQRSPHFTASASVDWRPVDSLRFSLGARHHSRYFSTDTNAQALLVEGHTIANARAAWTTGRTTLFGYARNMFDTFYMTHLSALNFGTAVDPRELGIGAEINF